MRAIHFMVLIAIFLCGISTVFSKEPLPSGGEIMGPHERMSSTGFTNHGDGVFTRSQTRAMKISSDLRQRNPNHIKNLLQGSSLTLLHIYFFGAYNRLINTAPNVLFPIDKIRRRLSREFHKAFEESDDQEIGHEFLFQGELDTRYYQIFDYYRNVAKFKNLDDYMRFNRKIFNKKGLESYTIFNNIFYSNNDYITKTKWYQNEKFVNPKDEKGPGLLTRYAKNMNEYVIKQRNCLKEDEDSKYDFFLGMAVYFVFPKHLGEPCKDTFGEMKRLIDDPRYGLRRLVEGKELSENEKKGLNAYGKKLGKIERLIEIDYGKATLYNPVPQEMKDALSFYRGGTRMVDKENRDRFYINKNLISKEIEPIRVSAGYIKKEEAIIDKLFDFLLNRLVISHSLDLRDQDLRGMDISTISVFSRLSGACYDDKTLKFAAVEGWDEQDFIDRRMIRDCPNIDANKLVFKFIQISDEKHDKFLLRGGIMDEEEIYSILHRLGYTKLGAYQK